METPNTTAGRLTESIMSQISQHLKPALANHPHPYNRTYEVILKVLTEHIKD